MAHWEERTYSSKPLGWTAKPGYCVFALGRGDVRFEYPRGWIVEPVPDDICIKIRDKRPPNDNGNLAASRAIINDEIDLTGFPLGPLVLKSLNNDYRKPYFVWDKVIEFNRPSARGAWAESRLIDPTEKRPVHSRQCRAIRSNVLALITFDYWESCAAEMTAHWDNVMSSLVIADYFELVEVSRKKKKK